MKRALLVLFVIFAGTFVTFAQNNQPSLRYSPYYVYNGEGQTLVYWTESYQDNFRPRVLQRIDNQIYLSGYNSFTKSLNTPSVSGDFKYFSIDTTQNNIILDGAIIAQSDFYLNTFSAGYIEKSVKLFTKTIGGDVSDFGSSANILDMGDSVNTFVMPSEMLYINSVSDADGSVRELVSLDDCMVYKAVKNGDDFALFYIGNEANPGFYARFYNEGETDVERVSYELFDSQMNDYPRFWFDLDTFHYFNVIANSDNTYLVLFHDHDGKKLKSMVVNKSGEVVGNVNSVDIPVTSDDVGNSNSQFAYYEISDSQFGMLVSYRGSEKDYNYNFICDNNGVFDNNYSVDSSLSFYAKDMLMYNDGKIGVLTIDENNVYFNWIEDFEVYRSYMLSNNFTNIEQDKDIMAVKFSLSQNYPNPFNPTTTVSFSLPESGNVNIVVYDLLGREVMSEGKYYSAGTHSFRIDASRWASGVYFYQFEAVGKFIETKKMILTK